MQPRTRLRQAREALGWTQEELAKRLGVSRLGVLNIEVGRRHPSHALMVRWAKELGVSIELFGPEELFGAESESSELPPAA
jgi:putative transcriptional regulator